MSEHLRTIEINGVKMEIDLRQAKRLDQFRIGDKVKVLVKEYSNYASYPGVIIGFDEFKNLPTIAICYLKTGYNPEVKFVFYNNETQDVEICHMSEADEVMEQNCANEYLDREILKKQSELADLEAKKAYFIKHYHQHLGDAFPLTV